MIADRMIKELSAPDLRRRIGPCGWFDQLRAPCGEVLPRLPRAELYVAESTPRDTPAT